MKNLKIFTDIIENEAADQINRLLEMNEFKDCKVRIMPDVHAGKGCVIGFAGCLGKYIIPNIVGLILDVGCLLFLLVNVILTIENLIKL